MVASGNRVAEPVGSTRWTAWAVSAGAALLGASGWLHAPSVEYVIVYVTATVATLVSLAGVNRAQRWWAAACSLTLAVGLLFAIPSQRELWLVRNKWDAWRYDTAVRGLAALRGAMDDAMHAAARAAIDALNASPDRTRAFDDLAPLTHGRDELGVVLYRADSAFAWAGMIRPPVDPRHDGVSVTVTPFYLALQVAEARANDRAVAVALLDALPPADGLSASIAQRVARQGGISNFTFTAAVDSSNRTDVLRYAVGGLRLFDVRDSVLTQGEVIQRITETARLRAGIALAFALVCFIIGVWRGTRAIAARVGALGFGIAALALVPLNQYSNLTRLFDPSVYFTPRGNPLTGSAGALAITSALVLLGILAVFRRRAHNVSRLWAIVTILLVVALGPFLLRDLARGIGVPVHGVDASLWLIWEIPLFLAAVSVLLAGALAGATVLGPRRGVRPWVAPLVATIAAVLAPIFWEAPGRLPGWYTVLWIVAIALLALSRRTRYVILSASTVAALGAVTLVWGRTARGRVDAAERDVASLNQIDPDAEALLGRFARTLSGELAPLTREALLQQYVASDVASAGNPVALFAWPDDARPVANFATADIPIPKDDLQRLVARARAANAALLQAVPTDTSVELVLAAPAASGGVTAVVLAPRTRLFDTDPFARLLGLDADLSAEPPYTVRLRDPVPGDVVGGPMVWRRGEGSVLHGDRVLQSGTRAEPVHVEVELRPLDALVQRGALIVLLDLALVGLLWLASVVADGGAGRWFRARRRTWGRSYRARLSLALFAFFVIPAATFAVWSYGQLASGATQSRALLVSETLRALSPSTALAAESDFLDMPLLVYRSGQLGQASDELYDDLAPTGRFLPPRVELSLAVRGEGTASELERVGDASALFGYRSFNNTTNGPSVIAAPARADELSLDRRRRDLGILVLFATAVGALAALWLSGIAARQLARPIGTLRAAALAIAAGAREPPLEGEPTVEFHPVFAAFRRMAADLNSSRTALEEAQRRTAAVLRNVASGVVAVDPDRCVSLANPRAELLLGCPLTAGTPFADCAPTPIAHAVEHFLISQHDEENFEVTLDQQQLRGTLTRLARGGVVVTLDDVSELARAQRVLAWGEMARQVAHEIKNPLTPIRLGVQHLRRARADARVDFDRVLDQNVNQILAEIDRLDEIARAFSRYGAAPDDRRKPVAVDVASIVREVVALERMGGADDTAVEWTEQGTDDAANAMARGDELKEVLLNVLENARLAEARHVSVGVDRSPQGDGASRVTITIRDDGHGIAPDVLPRIFEPHFSTRTSGSGLGLAISRQLVEGWGGNITVESELGKGATASIALVAV